MAREQPRLHFLYREIANASAAFDRVELRKRIFAMTNRSPDLLHGFMMPALFITGGEDIAKGANDDGYGSQHRNSGDMTGTADNQEE